MIVASLGSRADAQLAPTPSPLDICPFHVAVVAGLDREPQVSQNYAVALESEFPQGNASGTLVFYAGNDRYEASFENAAPSVRGESPDTATPIVVQFPSAVHVDAAYVGSVEMPIAGYCNPDNVWLADEVGEAATTSSSDLARFRKAAAHSAAVDASPPQEDAPPSCDHPDVAAHPTQMPTGAAALMQALQKSTAATSVAIAVALTPSGTIAATKVLLSTAGHTAEEEALHEALHTSYTAEQFRCEPIASTYIFTYSPH
jgi:hypothetical protein